MRYSRLFGRTLRETRSDGMPRAYHLIVRAGLARVLPDNRHALLPLGMLVLRHIEAVVQQELRAIVAQEVHIPPHYTYADVQNLVARDISSYRQLPVVLFQTTVSATSQEQRGDVVALRDSVQVEGISLDTSEAEQASTLQELVATMCQALQRCGLSGVRVLLRNQNTGIFGQVVPTHVCVVTSPAGDEMLAHCEACGYEAFLDMATCSSSSETDHDDSTQPPPAMELVETPQCATIADLATFLNVPESATAKAVFFDTLEHGLVFVVIRGDLAIDETKLKTRGAISVLRPATPEQIRAAGAVPGYASPVGLEGVPVFADHSVVTAGPLVAGANREGYHMRHVVYGRDWNATHVANLCLVREGAACSHCGEPLSFVRGVELASVSSHAATLRTNQDTHESPQITPPVYLDQNGTTQPVVIGGFRILLERCIQILVEQCADETGIVWPAAVAPCNVHLIRLGKGNDVAQAADELYQELTEAGWQVLYDDRPDSAGVKFNDADLLGLPVRIVVSTRLLQEHQVEVKPRIGEAYKVQRADIGQVLRNYVKSED